ncbi:MAG: dihydrolipoamide acetyltransferase family protein [Negativicutes bacterium]
MAVTVFKMSQISMTMVEGRVVKWLKNENDAVTEGEALVEIETDKIVVEITAPATGLVRKIMVPEGEYAAVEAPLCLIAGASDDISGYLASGDRQVEITLHAPLPGGKVKVSPLARKIAQQFGLNFAVLAGSGPGGLIVRADVERALEEKEKQGMQSVLRTVQRETKQEESPAAVEIVPLQGIRKRIAEHLTLSKQAAADVTTVMDVDMTKVAELRKILAISYTAFVVRAAAKALQEYPMLNASLVDQFIHIKKHINVCVAVATETGLVTPVIPATNRKNILTVAEEMDELARKAREGALTSADFADGTFTVTNSGTFGSLFFTPIINYPQCAILGIGKVAQTPIVRDSAIVAAPVMYLCLTYDHRIVDGETAVKFLKTVKTNLEEPDQMITNKKD